MLVRTGLLGMTRQRFGKGRESSGPGWTAEGDDLRDGSNSGLVQRSQGVAGERERAERMRE
ncbi:hypothetical protein CDL15_Pgr016323 [Punica granatum]|uniref:Uncharacterized protein n=1 Tax=Punica granatum TaxID=22663 RepID=A0A218W6G1_PUNGR|nr:hypothetical protein CDL15_Pgr016323 [Punica granatum]